MKTRRFLIFIVYFLIVAILFLSSILIVCVLFFVTSVNENSSKNKVDDQGYYAYSYYELNPRTEESSVKYFTQIHPLDNENQFYENSDNNLVLVSNLEDTKFQCHGVCSCENNRRSSIAVRSTVIYLVASISSVLAYRKAKDYFETECIENLKDECPGNSNIISEVEDCERIEESVEDELDEKHDIPNMSFRNAKQVNKKTKHLIEREQTRKKQSYRSGVKMVIVMRTDIKMGKGKVGAQCVHAAMNGVRKLKKSNKDLSEWVGDGEKTVVVGVKSYEEFLDLHREASMSGVPVSSIIRDAGRTSFREPTATCFAIGPAKEEAVTKLTSKLKLM